MQVIIELSYLFFAVFSPIITFGWTLAYFNNEFSTILEKIEKENFVFSFLMAIISFVFPPLLFLIFFSTNFAKHGWQISANKN